MHIEYKCSESRSIRAPPGARIGSGREPPEGCGDSPLQEQSVPITAEPPLQLSHIPGSRDLLGHVASLGCLGYRTPRQSAEGQRSLVLKVLTLLNSLYSKRTE